MPPRVPFPLLFFALAATVAPTLGVGRADAQPVLLFPYFEGNGENGVSLAWSEDGRAFRAVNGGEPVFKPPRWGDGQHLTRDPSVVYHRGLFHLVWTSNWSGRWLGYASSPDLVNWSEPKRLQPFPEGHEQPNNVWAPELLRDHAADDFKIVWSSTLPSEYEDGDGSEDTHRGDHRIYYTATTDFETFSRPEPILRDPGWSVIDGQIAWDEADGRWVMPLKNELLAERGGKNLRLAFSPAEIKPGSFGGLTEPIVGAGTAISGRHMAEGPTLIRWRGEWLLYWDSYGAGHYSLATSPDLVKWSDETRSLKMPAGHPRHGTVFSAERSAVGWPLE